MQINISKRNSKMENAISSSAEVTAVTGKKTRMLALAAGVGVMTLLFGWWPYQTWDTILRTSVFSGWVGITNRANGGEWQFCLIVPFIVGFLVYRERERLIGKPLQGRWMGVFPLAIGALFYFFGFKVNTGYLGYAALQTVLAGLILLLAGREWWRTLFFSWLFLFFAWPLFPLDNLLAAQLKIPTAEMAAIILRWFGVGTVREGSALSSASDVLSSLTQGAKFHLEVSDSCSGMRSLYTLLMVAALYGHLALRRALPKLIVFCSAIPLAVAGNVVRLLMLAFGSLWFGQKFAIGSQNGDHLEESTYHLLCGFAVFGVALAGMFALASFLEGRHWKGMKLFDSVKIKRSDASTADMPFSELMKRVLTALALGATGIGLCMLAPSRMIFDEPGMRAELPAEVGEYQSMQQGMTSKEQNNFDPTVKLDRRYYAAPNGRQIMATLVLAGEKKKTLHPPTICLPDAGWIITDLSEMPLLMDDGRTIEVSLMRVFRDYEPVPGQRERITGLNIYWYEGTKGASTPSFFMTDIITYWDAIFLNRNHRWGQASFFLPMHESENEKRNPMDELMALEDLKEFVAKAAPQFLIAPK